MIRKKLHEFNWNHFIEVAQERFKKRFKKNITPTQIRKIWDVWVKHRIINKVIEGDCVIIDRHSSIQLIGTPILEDKRFFAMLLRGRMSMRDGTAKIAERHQKRKDYKFKIVYKNDTAKGKLFFKAIPSFSKAAHESIINTNTYYKINVNQ